MKTQRLSSFNIALLVATMAAGLSGCSEPPIEPQPETKYKLNDLTRPGVVMTNVQGGPSQSDTLLNIPCTCMPRTPVMAQ